MLLTPKDIGTLVEHTVWQRGKVLDVTPPYAIIHFTSLLATPQGPERKLREDAPQISKSKVPSDPELDLIGNGKPKKSKAKAKAKGLVHHLDEAIAWFEKTYPNKFEDEKFVDADLRNKRAAHDVFVANFGGSRGQKLIDQGKHAETTEGQSIDDGHLGRGAQVQAMRTEGTEHGRQCTGHQTGVLSSGHTAIDNGWLTWVHCDHLRHIRSTGL